MTNDYKANLLEYLTGNVTEQVESSTPLLVETSTKEYQYPKFPMKQVRCKDGKGNYNGKVLYYQRGGNEVSLLDENMNVLKTFTTFSSGTSLGTILNLEVDEVGNVYGLDYITVNGVVTYRIILMNNISEIAKGQSDYSIVLRNSYYVQGYTEEDDLSPTFETFLAKSTQSAIYYFAIQDSTGTVLMPSTFQINVGSANTWTRLNEFVFINGDIGVGNIYFDTNDTPVAEYYATEMLTNDWKITKGTATGEGSSTYTTVIDNIMGNYYNTPITDIQNFTIQLIPNYFGSVYMILTGMYKSNTISGTAQYKARITVYLVNGTKAIQLLERDSDIEAPMSSMVPSFSRGLVIDNVLLLYIGLPIDTSSNVGIYFDLLAENNDVDYFTDTGATDIWGQFTLTRVGGYNTYNLFNFSAVYTKDDVRYITTTKTVYNQFNYNGGEHKDNNMLVPRQGLLFDTNNSLLFARNLYNLKVYNNQTMATLNVPYNLLNDTTIAKQSLYGETNYELVENTHALSKNVYEDLYINFINAMKMTNENNDMVTNNMPGAVRLNQSVSKVLDYENAKASKIRVTYDDDTSYITSASNTINNGVCTYSIGVHIPSDTNIQKIEIISDDEATTYQTISNLNLENNKYYVITQDVHVV